MCVYEYSMHVKIHYFQNETVCGFHITKNTHRHTNMFHTEPYFDQLCCSLCDVRYAYFQHL